MKLGQIVAHKNTQFFHMTIRKQTGTWHIYKPLFGSSVATWQLTCSEVSLSIHKKKLEKS